VEHILEDILRNVSRDFFCPYKPMVTKTIEFFHLLIKKSIHCKPPSYTVKIFSRFVITTYFLLSNQLYNNLFS